MRGMFLRIFVAFFLAMSLAGAGFALVVSREPEGPGRRHWRAFITDSVRIRGEEIERRVALGDEAGARKELLALAHRDHFRAYFVSNPGTSELVLGPDVAPAAVRALARRAGRKHRSIEEPSADETMMLVAVPLSRGVICAAFPTPSRLHLIFGHWSRLPLRVGVVFLALGLVAYALARYLTRPLAHLRAATQGIAGGDLSVRVASRLGTAPEEIRSLGADFDRMAERIALLLEGQERLLRDVSHELRSPLARMTLTLELARKRMPGDASAELDRIALEAERLGALVGHILTLTRLTEESNLVEEDVDLGSIVAGVVHDADFEASRTGRRVALADHAPVMVHAHAEALRWAIENVVRNAVAYTAEGTCVDVSVRADPRARRVSVVTRDHGPGIPEDALESIFRPFFRVGTDRDRRSGGTGVGLAITARVASRHGGRAFAALPAGGGLEVTFELPIAADPAGS